MGAPALIGPKMKDWLSAKCAKLDLDAHLFAESFHIDEMGAELNSVEADIGTGLEALRFAKNLLDGGRSGIRVALAIPLGTSSLLDTDLPDPWSIAPLAPYEPPSLYFFSGDYESSPPEREEYLCPYSVVPWGNDLVGYYACGRSTLDRERGWEFTKTIWVSIPNDQ